MRAQLAELGGGFSKEAIENADEYDDNLIKLNFSLRGIKSLIGVQIFPVISDLLNVVTKTGSAFTGWIKETTFLSTAVKVLIGLVGVKLLAALAPFLLPGLKFVAIFLAVDDLIAFLTGKKSVIGDILDSWFGRGTAAVVQQWCASAGAAIKELIGGSLLLLKLAFTADAKAASEIGDEFLRSTNKIGDAVDWVLDKLKTLKDAFTDFDTLKEGFIQGAESIGLLVAKVSGDDGLAGRILNGRANRTLDRANAQIDADPNLSSMNGRKPIKVSGPSAASAGFDALAQKFAPIPLTNPLGFGGAPSNVTIAPVVTQDLRGADAKSAAAIKKATQEGVTAGISDYRAAMLSLEQRAKK